MVRVSLSQPQAPTELMFDQSPSPLAGRDAAGAGGCGSEDGGGRAGAPGQPAPRRARQQRGGALPALVLVLVLGGCCWLGCTPLPDRLIVIPHFPNTPSHPNTASTPQRQTQVAGSSEPVETLSLDHFKQVHDVNVLGPLRMLQAFLPMLRQAKGRVINISRYVWVCGVEWVCGVDC